MQLLSGDDGMKLWIGVKRPHEGDATSLRAQFQRSKPNNKTLKLTTENYPQVKFRPLQPNPRLLGDVE